MKKILIAGWETAIDKYDDDIAAFAKLGCKAFLSLNPEDADDVDGIVFPGSMQGVNPKLWGAESQENCELNDELDRRQGVFLEKAIEKRIPVLGICRGMQYINVHLGGMLNQKIPSWQIHRITKPESYHQMHPMEGTFMERLFGEETEINTRHYWAVENLGKGLYLTALWHNPDSREEQVIEGYAHKDYPIIGVQWHPERMVVHGDPVQQENGKKMLEYWLNL